MTPSASPVAPVVVALRTVAELWSLLDPLEPLAGLASTPNDLVFRGQADARWGLWPSIERPCGGGTRRPAELVFKRDQLPADAYAVAELLLLGHFARACDRLALTLPNDSSAFRQHWFRENSAGLDGIAKKPETWPPNELFDLLALAQHHGLPTRLLDWTRRGHVAAYFAAEGALRASGPEEGEFAVWALDLERRGLFNEVEVVRVPGATSRNLAAQDGLFTLVRGFGSCGQSYVPKRIEDILDSKFAHNPGACPLWKLTLPRSEAARLLERCGKFGISAATLFPGYDGAARDVMSQVLGGY